MAPFTTTAAAVHEAVMLKDLKESLSSSRKADLTHVRKHFMIYTSRPCELGSEKYERSNFLRPTGGELHTVPTRADFERFRAYLRAAVSHIGETLQSMEEYQAGDPNLVNAEGMKTAAYAVDTDVTPGGKVGASMLPHIAPACASLMMAIEQAVACGLLPGDPGTPWRVAKTEVAGLRETLMGPPMTFAKILANNNAPIPANPKEGY